MEASQFEIHAASPEAGSDVTDAGSLGSTNQVGNTYAAQLEYSRRAWKVLITFRKFAAGVAGWSGIVGGSVFMDDLGRTVSGIVRHSRSELVDGGRAAGK